MNWLLLFVPIAIALEFLAPAQHTAIFVAAGLAIVPLAGWMAEATEHLAARTGEGIGGLLNATFGNAAELIIALSALRAGMHDIVKASIAGSIVGNILFTMGLSMLLGGLRHKEQTYNAMGTKSQATMLTLAVIALVLPAAYQNMIGREGNLGLGGVSIAISILLLIVYAGNLVFVLITHRGLFAGAVDHGAASDDSGKEKETAEKEHEWSLGKSIGVLTGATVVIAFMSEILVGAIEPTGEGLGINTMFMGVFVVAILGNAAERRSAIVAALKNRMDLSLAIPIGASVQIALFVTPVLILLSYFISPEPLDFAFGRGLVLSMFLAVVIAGQITDGRSNWLRGVQLLAAYAILGIVYFFVPHVPT